MNEIPFFLGAVDVYRFIYFFNKYISSYLERINFVSLFCSGDDP